MFCLPGSGVQSEKSPIREILSLSLFPSEGERVPKAGEGLVCDAVEQQGAVEASPSPGVKPFGEKPHPHQQDRPESSGLALRIRGRDQLIKVCDGLLESGADIIDIK
jgi:hypothetical protein